VRPTSRADPTSASSSPACADRLPELTAELERLRQAYEPGFDPDATGMKGRGPKSGP
jgi:hypothetical protein